MYASKAAIIGGFNSTSNVLAGKDYGLKVTGTMAHSWIQSFVDELTAFRTFVKLRPNYSILLVDTTSTLESGVPNAIKIAKEMELEGKKLLGIRLDSGDLSYLSKKARVMLDDAKLDYVKIVASNQLNEQVIMSLEQQRAPIDVFGVGTDLAVAAGSPSHDGVYKLSSCAGKDKMKRSDNISKRTLPGAKNVFRFMQDNEYYADGITCAGLKTPDEVIDLLFPEKVTDVKEMLATPF
jgi:nicotinate phosphoribosyltransferase